MPIEILMPALSPTMTEGNLAKWVKKEGDKVKPGEVIAEIETDKATMEVEATDAGVIGRIVIAEGTEGVAVNALIALLLEDGEDKTTLESYKPANNNQPAAALDAPKVTEVAKSAPIVQNSGARIFASPLAKRIAEQEKVNLANIAGTGPHGRIVKADVLSQKGASPAIANISSFGRNGEEYTKIPNNNMRKVIAKRLLESKQTVPHFYLSVECVIDDLLAARVRINDEAKGAVKLSVNDFAIKAVASALKKVPAANSSWTDEAVLLYNNIDISVAVAIDGGLITPIIKNADQKSLSQISDEMKDLAARARAGKLAPEEFQGGGFSISNLGMYGISHFNAIINPPQACILAIGAGEQKPVVRNGAVVAGTVMVATLSCDHRAVDGAVGAEFLQAFKRNIENPLNMLV